MIVFFLNQPRDVPLAMLLLKTCPKLIKIIFSKFNRKDEYNWTKSKYIEKNFTWSQSNMVKRYLPKESIVYCSSYRKFKNILSDTDIFIDRGRALIVSKPIAKKNIALSMNRCYFNRLLDVLPYYKNNNLKIFLHSDAWLSEKLAGDFMMGENNYSIITSNQTCFETVDILGCYYDILKNLGKKKIKAELKLPQDQKIVFLSFRKAEKTFSIYDTNDQFISTVKKNLESLKDQGYYIVSRRRLGKHDIRAYKVLGSPDIERFNEVSPLIDREFNGIGGFPDLLWKVMYVSDVHYMADISGIGYVEAALCRCPAYMPFNESWFKVKLNNINPALKDMVNRGLIFNELTENNIHHYKDNIEDFLKIWYNTNPERFWDKILE